MTQRYLGGIITANPVEPSENFQDSAASGMWTMQEALSFSKAGDWPDPAIISPSKFVENVFSTYVYTGTGSGSSQTITNGIDLDGEGGLVWIKNREIAYSHVLVDTETGAQKMLNSNSTSAQANYTSGLTSFNSNGFTHGGATLVGSTSKITSWTFRKQPKFFDVVTYTGDGTTSREVSHNLGTTIGFMLVKRTDAASNWACIAYNGTNYGCLVLNSSAAQLFSSATSSYTSTMFKPYDVFQQFTDTPVNDRMNVDGASYVAYIFAHNNSDGGFGSTGDQDIIKCGSYTGNGSTSNTVTLGFEPQWILIKNATASADWILFDTVRGIVTGGNEVGLIPNTSEVELSQDFLQVTSQGFELTVNNSYTNNSGKTYVYMAIRKGLMKAPTAGTDVLTILKEDSANLNQSPKYLQPSAFPVDFIINKVYAGGTSSWWSATRMTNARLQLESTAAETSVATTHEFDRMNGVAVSGLSGATTFMGYMFRRAPKFFDIVAYTGTGAVRTVTHNLEVTPEFMIIKARDAVEPWPVYHSALGNTKYLNINNNGTGGATIIAWNNTDPTSSVFTTGVWNNVNGSGTDYIGYLFATLAGVSKVGTYSGTGSDVAVDCGFTSGARFVLAKRTDAAGSWYVWDSARGIIAGNDPYLLTDSVADHVTNTDYIDPLSSGFTITSNAGSDLNHNGGSYVFLAIA
jgi:hypothetical protein